MNYQEEFFKYEGLLKSRSADVAGLYISGYQCKYIDWNGERTPDCVFGCITESGLWM